MTDFNPNDVAAKDSGIFRLPFDATDAKLILLPVPWEATTSYGGGTADGPKAIFAASKQIDLFDLELGNFFKAGIAMLDENRALQEWNHIAKEAAQKIISAEDISEDEVASSIKIVNSYSEKVNDFVYQQTKKYLIEGKLVGLV